MLAYIQVRPYVGKNSEDNNKYNRTYLFPYKIGDKLTSNAGNCMWDPDYKRDLQTNLATEFDLFAVHQKLLRLGNLIKEQELQISCIQTAWFEDDVLEVFAEGRCLEPTETLKQFDSLLSRAFGLPVRL